MKATLVDPASSGASTSTTTYLGPANWHTRVESGLMRVTIKPAFHGLTSVGRVINRVNPDYLQRTSLAGPDSLMRYIRPVRGIVARRVSLPHCEAEWLEPSGIDKESAPVILYFHGGAFIAGSMYSHRPLTSRLARQFGVRVLSVNYRLLPRFGADEAMEDCIDAYRVVLDSGVSPNRVVFAGDSAGGYFSALAPVQARASGLPVPAGQVLLSGLTTSDLSAKFSAAAARSDAMFSRGTIQFINDVYVRGNGLRPVPMTPVDTDLSGLGPFLLQIGSGEMLYNDAIALTQRLAAAGVPYTLQVFDRAPHVFQFASPTNPDAARALGFVGRFIADVTGTVARGEAGNLSRRRRTA